MLKIDNFAKNYQFLALMYLFAKIISISKENHNLATKKIR